MFDIYESRQLYEDRVKQLRKDYGKSEGKQTRKLIKRVAKLFTLRIV